jgi:hypothetical protein
MALRESAVLLWAVSGGWDGREICTVRGVAAIPTDEQDTMLLGWFCFRRPGGTPKHSGVPQRNVTSSFCTCLGCIPSSGRAEGRYGVWPLHHEEHYRVPAPVAA